MSIIKRTPTIRFKGFEEDWEERKLDEITISYSGGTPSVGVKSYYNGEIPFIRSGEINSVQTELFISEDGLARSSAKIVDIGDILYALYGATSGEVGISNIRGAINQAILAIKPKVNFNSYYLSYWLRKQKSQIIGTYLQGGQGNLSGNIIKSLVILVPNNKEATEQSQIGNYFKELDVMIRLQEQKLEKVINLKKAMLEKMFPTANTNVPKIRFKGFTDKWGKKMLGEVADIVGGGTPSTSNADFWNGSIDWYSPTEIGTKVFADGSEKKITELGLEKSSATILPANRTILFTSRAGIGDMAILRHQAATNQGFQSLVLKVGYDVYFIYSMGFLMKDYALKYASGSTFLEISGKVLAKMAFMVPSFSEQQKIGEYFQNLDELISQSQQKVKKLKNLKQAFLQKMFI